MEIESKQPQRRNRVSLRGRQILERLKEIKQEMVYKLYSFIEDEIKIVETN